MFYGKPNIRTWIIRECCDNSDISIKTGLDLVLIILDQRYPYYPVISSPDIIFEFMFKGNPQIEMRAAIKACQIVSIKFQPKF